VTSLRALQDLGRRRSRALAGAAFGRTGADQPRSRTAAGLSPVRPVSGRGTTGLAPVRPGGTSGFDRALSGGRRSGRRLGGLARRAVGRNSVLRHIDYVLLLAALGLSGLGAVLVWSAVGASGAGGGRSYLVREAIGIVLGLVCMFLVSMLGYRQLKLYAPVVYGISILGLLAVFSPLGKTVNGSRSWVKLPAGFELEPSEIAKLGVILMTAMILSELRRGDSRPRIRAVALASLCALVPIALVYKQPDLGVVIILLLIVAGMIALSGIRLWLLGSMTAAAVLAVLAVLKLNLLKGYQKARIEAFLHPSANPLTTGYQAHQARLAVGSGGMFGEGLFHGHLLAGSFITNPQTDFIFAVAGEQLGFIGAAVIVGLFAIVLLRALRIAQRADDQFGMLVAVGVAIWLAVQAFINIGMTVGLIPVTGVPLPFLSYGDSAMVIDFIAVGALQAVHRRRSMFN
jgi:rod shape determining protein RodA